MAFMFTDLSGEIRIAGYTPSTAIHLYKGKEEALRSAALALAEGEDGRLYIPGIRDLPAGPSQYFARKEAISAFARRVEAMLKGGA